VFERSLLNYKLSNVHWHLTTRGWIERILQSFDFTVNRSFMTLFKTSSIEIVHYCQTVFNCELSSVLLVKRYEKFTEKLAGASV